MKSSRDYLGLSNSCSNNVDDVIGRADRFRFQNFCSPAQGIWFVLYMNSALYEVCLQHK